MYDTQADGVNFSAQSAPWLRLAGAKHLCLMGVAVCLGPYPR